MKRFNNYCTFLIVVILLGATAVAYSADSVYNRIISPQKSIISSGDYVFAKGRWKKTEGTDRLKIITPPAINTVDIVCDKEAMTCFECIAQLVTTKDMGKIAAMEIQPQLTIETAIFRIIDWSDDIIIAKASFFPSDYMLRISVKDSYGERHRQETKARGDDSADPNIFERWVLE